MKVGILACSKTKAPVPLPAKVLYRGRTFRMAYRLLIGMGCERVIVLSAEHGAIDAETVIGPYSRSLSYVDARTRRAWERRAAADLKRLLSPEDEVVAVVPSLYAGALREAGLLEVRRFVGLPQGKLYQALVGAVREVEANAA